MRGTICLSVRLPSFPCLAFVTSVHVGMYHTQRATSKTHTGTWYIPSERSASSADCPCPSLYPLAVRCYHSRPSSSRVPHQSLLSMHPALCGEQGHPAVDHHRHRPGERHWLYQLVDVSRWMPTRGNDRGDRYSSTSVRHHQQSDALIHDQQWGERRKPSHGSSLCCPVS